MLNGSNPTSDTRPTTRSAIHESPVHFRAKASLVTAAKELAAKRGMSLAEFMRHALRREMEAANLAEAPRDHGGKLSAMDTVVRRAARGDVEAQRQQILNSIINANADPSLRTNALLQAEHWARMAALTGDGDDHIRLTAVLGLRIVECKERGDTATASLLEAEAIGIVSVLADEGDEYYASMLGTLSDLASPTTLQGARDYVESWKAAV